MRELKAVGKRERHAYCALSSGPLRDPVPLPIAWHAGFVSFIRSVDDAGRLSGAASPAPTRESALPLLAHATPPSFG